MRELKGKANKQKQKDKKNASSQKSKKGTHKESKIEERKIKISSLIFTWKIICRKMKRANKAILSVKFSNYPSKKKLEQKIRRNSLSSRSFKTKNSQYKWNNSKIKPINSPSFQSKNAPKLLKA